VEVELFNADRQDEANIRFSQTVPWTCLQCNECL